MHIYHTISVKWRDVDRRIDRYILIYKNEYGKLRRDIQLSASPYIKVNWIIIQICTIFEGNEFKISRKKKKNLNELINFIYPEINLETYQVIFYVSTYIIS